MTPNQQSFEKRTAIVFASSRGIGRATAIKLGSKGANVVVTYVGNELQASEAAEQVRSTGGSAETIKVDVSNAEDVLAAFDLAESTFGAVDTVINAAGASTFGLTATLSRSDTEKLVAINVWGAFNVLSESARRIADGGAIVQFSTGGTKMAVPGGGVYSATKAAGEHMALGLAKELGERQVNVNVISPGITDTDGLIMPEEQVQALIQQTPLGRLGQPGDVADAVLFLVSREAQWVTGQNLQANGGIL